MIPMTGTVPAPYMKTKTRKTADMDGDFKALKKTFNVLGTISLIMIFFFGFIIFFSALPKIFSVTSRNSGKTQIEQESVKIKFDDHMSNNFIAFEAIKLIYSTTRKDAQFVILVEKALITEENELIVDIINNIYSTNVKSNAIDIAFDYYIRTHKYNLAANIIQYN